MKRSKRQENAIVINFIFYFILFISFLAIFFSYILPNFIEIEGLKEETQEYFSDFKEIEKKGISFDDFTSKTKVSDLKKYFEENKGSNLDYISGIVNSISKEFYDRNFINANEANFDTFIKKLEQKQKEENDSEKKLAVVSKILPSYSENIYELDGEGSLTDFKFINYIESIFSAFNLSYDNAVGITNLTILPDYIIGLGDSSLDKNIFYIPLEFDLEGSKLSIINFLHFVEHVGKISIDKSLTGDDKSPGEIIIYSEKYKPGDYFYNFKNIRFANDLENKNIFNNQIFSIDSISFKEYINSSFDISDLSGNKHLSFLEFLKETNQLPERFKIKVQLRFYVKGQPKFKIEKFINNFITKYNDTRSTLIAMLKNGNMNSSDTQKIKNIKTTIDNLSVLVGGLSITSKEKNLTDIYNEAYKYNTFLDTEIKKINKINEKLGNIEK